MCQNVSNAILAWFNFQAKFPSRSGVWVQGEWQKNARASEGLKDIGHSTSMDNLILGASSVTIFYLIHYDSLLQNMSSFLLQNTTVLLQNAAVITNCDSTPMLCDSAFNSNNVKTILTILKTNNRVFQISSIPFFSQKQNNVFHVMELQI